MLRGGRRARSYLWGEGDSYMDGAGGIALKTLLATATGRPVTNTAVGGSTLTDIKARILASPDLVRQCRPVIWDGSATEYSSVNAYLALVDGVLAITGSNVVYLPPLSPGPSISSSIDAYTADMISIYTGLVARGVGTFDPIDVLGPLGDGSANDLQDYAARVIPRSLRIDSVHTNSTALTAIASRINTLLTTRGWPA